MAPSAGHRSVDGPAPVARAAGDDLSNPAGHRPGDGARRPPESQTSGGGSIPPAPSPPPPTPAATADLGRLWERIPRLPGGPASLMSAQGLSQDATMLLVMVDGSTKLRGLRTLAPHVDDARFAAVVRDAVSRGLLVLE